MPVSASERFVRFFETTSDCQFYVKRDVDGRFKYVHVNPAALSVTGLSDESQIIGLTPVEALGEDYGLTVQRNILEAANNAKPFRFRGVLGQSGHGPVYDASYFPLSDDQGNVVGVLGSARDVSEIDSLQERLLHSKKLEALGELAGSVTHDFGNILTVMEGAIRFLSKPDLPDETRAKVISEARRSLTNGLTLTKRLGLFARKEKPKAVPHDVYDLISSALFMMQRVVGRSVAIDIDVPPGLWEVCCDRSEFEIAMMNLATNARDAVAERGTVTIAAINGCREQNDPAHFPEEYVAIIVRDDGCGMADDVRAKATDPFFSTKAEGQGTGLGLSSVMRFVLEMKGAMTIESELGQGTAISMLLPRPRSDPE